MKKTLLFLITAAVCMNSATAQNTPLALNGVVYNPDGISLTYVEGSGSIKGFFIGRYEVTQAQWKAVMGDNPSHFKGDNLPVEQVSWFDAREFLKKLNAKTGRSYRLPTGAEWVYAAKGGTNRDSFEYAGSNSVGEVARYGDMSGNSGSRTHAVGTKKPNSLGIYDMSGNVSEWCQDWDSKNIDEEYVHHRGGSWLTDAEGCSVASRYDDDPSIHSYFTGFRVVLP